MAQKFHFAILRIEVTRASRGLSAIAELLVEIGVQRGIGGKSPTPPVFGAPVGVTAFEFREDLWRQTRWAVVWRCVRGRTFSRFFVEHRLVTDEQTDRHRATAYTALA